jgi:hypothetical protein
MNWIIQHTPEWLKALAAFITALGGAYAVFFKYKKRNAGEGVHAKSFKNEVRLNTAADTAINTLLAAQENIHIVSIAEWRNGENPKRFRLKRSTDFNTWSLWKEWQIPEDSLIRIQSVTLDEGYC